MIRNSRYPYTLSGSAALHRRAGEALAGATSHDSWRLEPFAPVFSRAKGAYKYDVDGKAFIDLWMGHGSLLLGHGQEEVLEAVRRQAARASHLSGLTVEMIEWAETIKSLVPSAERVRFTASGSEAAHLAFRVARSFTGRPTIIRLNGHFHGWHENLLAGVVDPAALGGSKVAVGGIAVCPPDDLDSIEDRIREGDIAALLLEPGGGGSGVLPWSSDYLVGLRTLADRHGVLLIFDEVISGFRYAPGGVQELAGVTPDLTLLAKIMAGGWPGGALVGKKEPMGVFAPGTERPHGLGRIVHAGTFNGFAPSAAAGIATLRRVSDGHVQRRAELAADRLSVGVNVAAAAHGLDIGMFSNSSTVHIVLGAASAGVELRPSVEAFSLVARQAAGHAVVRRELLTAGIDMHMSHGWLSDAHDGAVIVEAIGRFDRAFGVLARQTAPEVPKLRSCTTVCYEPACACRQRSFAGCNAPLADDSIRRAVS